MSEGRQPGTGRAGAVMFGLAWLLGLALAASYFNGWFERQRNPNDEPASRSTATGIEVELAPNRQGHYVATGFLNDSPVELLLDTGATTIAVPVELAERLALPRGQAVPLNTANGVTTGYVTRLRSVSLGAITLRDVAAVIAPGLHDDQVLLGMSFLDRLDWQREAGMLRLRTR